VYDGDHCLGGAVIEQTFPVTANRVAA